jgi:CheY-like chemotaxis protein
VQSEPERPCSSSTTSRRSVASNGVGYGVLEATNGADAIDRMAGAARVDLLVADLQMPEVCGAEMVRRIRLTRPDMPVLYVTGHIDGLMDERSLWEGEAFLEKPFTVAALRQAVSLLLYGTLATPRSEQTREARVNSSELIGRSSTEC